MVIESFSDNLAIPDPVPGKREPRVRAWVAASGYAGVGPSRTRRSVPREYADRSIVNGGIGHREHLDVSGKIGDSLALSGSRAA